MEQLFGSIPVVLDGLGPSAEVDEAVVFAAWKRCAGAMLAERAVPCEFFENRLIIAVQDDMWRRHLEELAPQMIARINAYLKQGHVRFIEFRVERARFAARKRHDPGADDEALVSVPPAIVEAARKITDLSLRANFLQTAAQYLARQESRP